MVKRLEFDEEEVLWDLAERHVAVLTGEGESLSEADAAELEASPRARAFVMTLMAGIQVGNAPTPKPPFQDEGPTYPQP